MIDKKPWYREVHWVKLALLILVFLALSVALVWVTRHLLRRYHPVMLNNEALVLLIVFFVCLVVNASLFPVPFAVPIMVLAAQRWDPVLVALVSSVGASLGEFTGYYLGFLTRKIALHNHLAGYSTVHGWVKRYGLWAIAFLSFQPIIPVELGGMVAGAVRMPVRTFLLALWMGKFPKYLLLIYAGLGLIKFFPSFAF